MHSFTHGCMLVTGPMCALLLVIVHRIIQPKHCINVFTHALNVPKIVLSS